MTSYVTTGLAIDPAGRENGCLRIIPGSHRLGYLCLSDDGPLMKGVTEEPVLRAAGLDPGAIVEIELEPGDLVMWSLLTVHGSDINRSQKDRAFLLSSYVKAANSDRGEWAFRDGESVALGPEPQLCKYEQLHTRPGPFYSDDKWYDD
jgi:ectoine hydroxylase-related dioxygenase (phytanoyl-CoA dioxygenase family)